MIIGLNAGHGIAGSNSIGAKSIICESTENRNVVKKLTEYLISQGHTVVDCTIDYPNNASDCINKIVTKANSTNMDLFVSIHFNAGANNVSGNGVTTGTEVYTYSATSSSNATAKRIVDKIATLGFRNRGLKHSTSFGVLRSTKAPAILVECCFVDDKDDCDLYKVDLMAKSIAEGILNTTISTTTTTPSTNTSTSTLYRVQVGAFGVKANAENLAKELQSKGYSAIIVG